MKYFVDLEGKIPAKEGDRVALARYEDGEEMLQEEMAYRPTLQGDGSISAEGAMEEGGERMYVAKTQAIYHETCAEVTRDE